MATKPTTSADWDTNGTNVSAPTAGHKSDGYTNNEIPTAAEWNAQFKLIGEWTKWVLESQLNDGVVDYSLTANTDDADLAGTGNLTNVHTVYVTVSGATSWNLNGIVGGVDKQEIQLVNVSTSEYVWLQNEATGSTAANRITLPTHWIPDANMNFLHILPGGSVRLRYHGASSRWKLVSAVGCRRPYALIIPANAIGYDDSVTGNTEISGAVQLGGTGGSVGYYPIVLPPNAYIDGFTVYVNKQSDATKTMTVSLWRRAGATTQNLSGSVSLSTAAPGYTSIPAAPSAVFTFEPTVATDQYLIQASSTSVVATEDWLLHAVVYAYIPLD